MTEQSVDAYILCVHCRATFTDAEIQGKNCCPRCGNKGVPADMRSRATVTLTYHEWRILFIWADNWGRQCGREDANFSSPISGIIKDVHRQAPELPGLTLGAEVQELANTLGTEVRMSNADGVDTIKPERKH